MNRYSSILKCFTRRKGTHLEEKVTLSLTVLKKRTIASYYVTSMRRRTRQKNSERRETKSARARERSSVTESARERMTVRERDQKCAKARPVCERDSVLERPKLIFKGKSSNTQLSKTPINNRNIKAEVQKKES